MPILEESIISPDLVLMILLLQWRDEAAAVHTGNLLRFGLVTSTLEVTLE